MLHKSREDFHQPPVLRPGYLEALEKELPRYSRLDGNEEPVHIGFVCDLFAGDVADARSVLEAFVRHGVPFQVLTKNPRMALEFVELFKACDASLGVTLTSIRYDVCADWEPNVLVGTTRLEALRRVREAGVSVWVSLEPVIRPEYTMRVIEELTGEPWFDGEMRVGKMNHVERCPRSLVEKYGLADVMWAPFALEAQRKLEAWGGRYMLKSGLMELLPASSRERYEQRQ